MERIKVLIVDDSRISQRMLSDIMSRTNFEVCATAVNAAEAVEKYQEFKPMAVTMDMNLPDADGIECSRRIRAIDPEARILMISAMKDASLMTKGREAGIRSFLQKPVSPNDLIDALTYLVQGRAKRVGELRDLYMQSFVKALNQSLFSLIGIQSDVTFEPADGNFLDVEGIAVIIGLTGTPAGRAIVYMDYDTMRSFAKALLASGDDIPDDDASDAVEEAANIIAGRCASTVNDLKKSEMRISPPGTIVGKKIRIANFKLTSFRIVAGTKIGDICMNIGFSEGE